jgi:hypothetical protein
MMNDPKRLPFPVRFILGWGKIRRAWLITCRSDYVRRSLTRRQGECRRTGACCNLMLRCPALENEGDFHRCTNYLHRGPNCSIFPIDERDIRDRDRIMPDVPCGYSFIPEATAKASGNGNGGGHTALQAFPWEIDGNALGGNVRRTNPFSMACAFIGTAWSVLRAPSRVNGRQKPRPPSGISV